MRSDSPKTDTKTHATIGVYFFFRPKWFVNGGAPYPKIVGKYAPFILVLRVVLVVHPWHMGEFFFKYPMDRGSFYFDSKPFLFIFFGGGCGLILRKVRDLRKRKREGASIV